VGEVLTWPVNFTSGTLKAVGKKGNATVTNEMKKAGAPAKLALVPDVKRLKADGRDVAQIELNVVDGQGTLVTDAANLITCSLQGPGEVIGLENGDLRTTEPYKTLTRSAYQGRLMVYVQSSKQPGEIKLTLTTPNLEGATLTLPVK